MPSPLKMFRDPSFGFCIVFVVKMSGLLSTTINFLVVTDLFNCFDLHASVSSVTEKEGILEKSMANMEEKESLKTIRLVKLGH